MNRLAATTVVALALLIAAPASASYELARAKTRIGVIDLVDEECTRARAAAARGPHWAFREPGGKSAVGSRKYFDEETELVSNGARFMDPGIGAFTGPEPFLQDPRFAALMAQRGLTTPTYAYAVNNPIKYTDPDGRFVLPLIPLAVKIGAAALAGAGIGFGLGFASSRFDPFGSPANEDVAPAKVIPLPFPTPDPDPGGGSCYNDRKSCYEECVKRSQFNQREWCADDLSMSSHLSTVAQYNCIDRVFALYQACKKRCDRLFPR